jgi:hypothetical protein
MRVLKHVGSLGVQSLDLGHLGCGMVAVSIVIWAGAAIAWKKRIQPKERT